MWLRSVLPACFLCLGQNGLQAVWLRTHCGDLASKPEHLDRAPDHSVEVDGDVSNGTYWYLPFQRGPANPRELLKGFLAFSILSLSFIFLCRSCSISPQLSLRRNCSLYGYVFQCAQARRQVQYFPMSLPSWTSPGDFLCYTDTWLIRTVLLEGNYLRFKNSAI